MSAEQLAAAKKAEEEISPEERAKRKRFHARLGALRTMNKDLAGMQLEARLQGKPSKGTVHKSRSRALKITVILNMMLEMRGLRLTYYPKTVCRHCGHITHPIKPQPIHAIRKEDADKAGELREELQVLFDLDEFIEDHKDK